MATETQVVSGPWLEKNFPCMSACPVNTEAGRYVNLIAQGKFREAYNVARKPNPFASICGRICAAPCEDACRRGQIDQPVSIRALKRFVCEQFGVESMVDLSRIREALGPALPSRSERIAVIGAGPAGLSAAHDLALLGYPVTVYEAQPVPGGMLRLGVPEYRLPRELIRLEINAILSLGVDLRLNQRLGEDFTIASLREDGYQAVFLAIGAHRSRELGIKGDHLDGVLRAVEFLLNANMGFRVDLGERVVVIGGGNVAIDVARMAVRQDTPAGLTAANMTEALDVARSAVRFGAKEVHLVCLESRNDMPADPEEVRDAEEERIILHDSRGPREILGSEGKVTGLRVVECVSLLDDTGRFNPTFNDDKVETISADTVILAVGQAPDLSWIEEGDGIETTERGTVKVDPLTMATSAPDIFCGGDVAFGPRIAIEAVANGRQAARSIDGYIRGSTASVEPEYEVSVFDPFRYRQIDGFERISRQPIPSLPIDRRVGVAQVEIGYDEVTAVREGRRCLKCWINTVFEANPATGLECIACGGCVDVCPESCIELVAGERIAFGSIERDVESAFAVDPPAEKRAVLIKDETACIRCGLCASRCPVGFITMQAFENRRREAG